MRWCCLPKVSKLVCACRKYSLSKLTNWASKPCGVRKVDQWRVFIMPRSLGGALSDVFVWRLTSVWRRLSRTSGITREQRGLGRPNWHAGSPRHTWLGHHFQGQKVKDQGHQVALFTASLTREAGAAVTARTYWGNYCYVASTQRRARRWGAHDGRRGAGAYRSPRAQLVEINYCVDFQGIDCTILVYPSCLVIRCAKSDSRRYL